MYNEGKRMMLMMRQTLGSNLPEKGLIIILLLWLRLRYATTPIAGAARCIDIQFSRPRADAEG
jgi:hypothetical protein